MTFALNPAIFAGWVPRPPAPKPVSLVKVVKPVPRWICPDCVVDWQAPEDACWSCGQPGRKPEEFVHTKLGTGWAPINPYRPNAPED